MASKEDREQRKDEARQMFEEDPSLEPKDVAKQKGLKVSVASALKGAVTRKRQKQKAVATQQDQVPTRQDFLKQLLEEINFKRIPAVLRLADIYGYHLVGVYGAMKGANATLATIRFVVEAWAGYEREIIPPWMAKEIRGAQTGPIYPPGNYGYGYNMPNAVPPDVSRELKDLRVENAKLEERNKTLEEKRNAAEQDAKTASHLYQAEHERALKAEHAKDLEALKSELKEEINQKVGSMSSDLGVLASVVKEGTGVGKRIERVLTSPLNIKPIPEKSQQPANTEATESIKDHLRKAGLVTTIRERVIHE